MIPAPSSRPRPSLDTSVGIVVCIPSFRRPKHLRLTLESLANQRTDRRFAVVIVENDAMDCESVPVVSRIPRSGKLQGLCVVEPLQGNCQAINAAFETALATFPAREPSSDDRRRRGRLAGLARTDAAHRRDHRRRSGRRAGMAEFDDDMKRGLRRHPAFRPAYETSGAVPMIYGCGNCLIARSVFERLGRSHVRSALQFPRRRRYRFFRPLPSTPE